MKIMREVRLDGENYLKIAFRMPLIHQNRRCRAIGENNSLKNEVILYNRADREDHMGNVGLITRYTIDGIIVVADSETIRNQGQDRYLADTIKHQLDAADIILLNKVDLPEPASLNETRQWLASEDADGHVIETENAAIPLPMVLGGHLNRITKEIAHQTKHEIPHTEHNAMVIFIDQPVDPETVAQQLSDPKLDLIRTKGFVCGLDGQIYAVQTVGRRRTISVAPHTPTDIGKIVCIRYRHPIDQQAISEVIANCKKTPLP
jgi:G3E family GTPase